MYLRYPLLVCFFLVSIGQGSVCVAQELPSGLDPGQIERDIKSDVDPIRVRPPQTNFGIVQDIPNAPEGAEDSRFILKKITFRGDKTVFSDAELLGDFVESLGTEISVAQLFEVAAVMSARYRNEGYLLSSVLVPAQEIDSGDVVFQVVEGYIDQIVIEEDGYSDKYPPVVRRYLYKVVNEKPLTRSTLERYLLLANDLPGISIASYIKPSKSSVGAATLTAKILPTEDDFSVRLDNRGTKFVGPYQFQASKAINAVKLGDSSLLGRLVFAPGEGRELQYGNLGYSEELDPEGTGVSVSVDAMRSEPGDAISNLGLKLESFGGTISVRSKILRSRSKNLTLSSTFNWSNSETSALDTLIFKDNSRTFSVNADFYFVDRFSGVSSVLAVLSRGLSVFGSTRASDPLLSKIDAEPNATWINLMVSRYQDLGEWMPRVSVLATVSMQYSFDPLSSSREFGVGGRSNGSAFDPSEITGDHGLSGRFELRYDLPVKDDITALDTQFTRIQSVNPYVFGDGGAVWHDNGQSTQQFHDRISSAGFGARLGFSRGFSGSIEVAKPFGKTITSEGDREPRIFVELSKLF